MKMGFHRHSNVHIPALPSIGKRRYTFDVHRSCGFNAERGRGGRLTIPRSVPIRDLRTIYGRRGKRLSLSAERFSIPPSLPQLIVPLKVARLISHTRILTAKSRRYRGSRLTACITVPFTLLLSLLVPMPWHQPSGRFRERVALGKMLPPAITGNVLPLLVG